MIHFLSLLMLTACEAPSDATMHQIGVSVTPDAQTTNDAFISLIDAATDSLVVALPQGHDELISLALIEAANAGVSVEVIADVDNSDEPVFSALDDADIEVTYGDHGIGYFDFALNEDLSWQSAQVQMTHAFVIADHVSAAVATNAGSKDDTAGQVLFSVQGEDLIDDLWIEYNQISGGTDAAELTYYSGASKSIADYRWIYPMHTGATLEVWFGPQERLVKRIIDATYGARSNIYVMTNDFTDAGLAIALQAKAATGFNVKVVVGEAFGSSSTALSDILKFDTPDVSKRRTMAGDQPTIVLVDTETGRDGRMHTTRAFVLSHDIYSATRIFDTAGATTGDNCSLCVTTDQYIDGSLWVINDYGTSSEEIATLSATFDAHFQAGGAL